MLEAWCEERERLEVVYIGARASTMKETEQSTTMVMILRGSGRYTQGLRASGATGGLVVPWVRLHPLILLLA